MNARDVGAADEARPDLDAALERSEWKETVAGLSTDCNAATDSGNADRLAAREHARLMYTHERGWWRYDSKRWTPDIIGLAAERAVAMAREDLEAVVLAAYGFATKSGSSWVRRSNRSSTRWPPLCTSTGSSPNRPQVSAAPWNAQQRAHGYGSRMRNWT